MYAVCRQAVGCKNVCGGVGSAGVRWRTIQVGIHGQHGIVGGVHHKFAALLVDLRDGRQPGKRHWQLCDRSNSTFEWGGTIQNDLVAGNNGPAGGHAHCVHDRI